MSHKEKLPKQFRQVISEALSFQLRDPKMDCVTVTHVRLSSDLQFADISVTLGGEEPEPVMAALSRARGALKRIIAKSIRLRRIPELRFHLDTSGEDVERIQQILDTLVIPPADPADVEDDDDLDDDAEGDDAEDDDLDEGDDDLDEDDDLDDDVEDDDDVDDDEA